MVKELQKLIELNKKYKNLCFKFTDTKNNYYIGIISNIEPVILKVSKEYYEAATNFQEISNKELNNYCKASISFLNSLTYNNKNYIVKNKELIRTI